MKLVKVKPGEKYVMPQQAVFPINVLVLGWEREIINVGVVDVFIRDDGLWAKAATDPEHDGLVTVVDHS